MGLKLGFKELFNQNLAGRDEFKKIKNYYVVYDLKKKDIGYVLELSRGIKIRHSLLLP
jgi:hypothetical protein